MKLGELTFRQFLTICLANKCETCPLWWPNTKWHGEHRAYTVCLKNVGMYHLLEVIDVEI